MPNDIKAPKLTLHTQSIAQTPAARHTHGLDKRTDSDPDKAKFLPVRRGNKVTTSVFKSHQNIKKRP